MSKVVEAWIQVAMRSLAGLAGVPLLQALGATAKAGNLPLPMGFPMNYLAGRVGSGVFGNEANEVNEIASVWSFCVLCKNFSCRKGVSQIGVVGQRSLFCVE